MKLIDNWMFKDIHSSIMLPSGSTHPLNHSYWWNICIETDNKIDFHYIKTFFTNACGNNDIEPASTKFLLKSINSVQVANRDSNHKPGLPTSKTACWTFCDWPFRDFPAILRLSSLSNVKNISKQIEVQARYI